MHDCFLRGFVGELSLVSPAAARSGQSSEIVADGAGDRQLCCRG